MLTRPQRPTPFTHGVEDLASGGVEGVAHRRIALLGGNEQVPAVVVPVDGTVCRSCTYDAYVKDGRTSRMVRYIHALVVGREV